MPIQSIYIEAGPEIVYDFLTSQLANTYKVSKNHLLNAKYSKPLHKAKQSVQLHQTITGVEGNTLLRFESKFGSDTTLSEYRLEAMDEGTLLYFSEEASSEKLSRKLNYKLFALPLFRKYSEKRLLSVLQSIKQQIEKDK